MTIDPLKRLNQYPIRLQRFAWLCSSQHSDADVGQRENPSSVKESPIKTHLLSAVPPPANEGASTGVRDQFRFREPSIGERTVLEMYCDNVSIRNSPYLPVKADD